MMLTLEELKTLHESKKNKIKERLSEFGDVMNQSDKRVFAELCFCICTPQSKAKVCDKVISELEKNNVLFKGNREQIRSYMYGVRFPENKTKFIIGARNLFSINNEIKIKDKIRSFEDIKALREWIVNNVKGLGWKESSHFLRNIGLGEDFAILDIHIQKNLERLEVIDKYKPNLSKKEYLEIEDKMRKFSKKIGIPLNELDLLLWSKETGEILK